MGGTDLSFERSCERQHLSDLHAICTMVAQTFLFFPSISIIPRVLSFMARCVVIYFMIMCIINREGGSRYHKSATAFYTSFSSRD
jgi:hypothetical protein